MTSKILLCSNCFKDQGLKLDSFKIGIEINKKCPNCNSNDGKKLTSDLIETLAHRFFVRGTLHKTNYGAAPIIQFNEHQKTSVEVSDLLQEDIRLIEESIGIGFFYYGPRLWMVGEVEPLKELQEKSKRYKVIEKIISDYPTRLLTDETFYRLRKNLKIPKEHNQYDSPPVTGNGRFDSVDLPILYGSQDLKVCVHECRVIVEDELYIASLQPKSELKLLDLTELLDESTTEFESLDIATHMLFYALLTLLA